MHCVFLGFVTIFGLTSSEKQEPTEEQIQQAIEAADRATLNPTKTENGDYTINIDLNTKDVIDSVDVDVYDVFYKRLYERTIIEANIHQNPNDHLMSAEHIAWEFRMHALAYFLGFSAAEETNLNYDETFWKMFTRAIGW